MYSKKKVALIVLMTFILTTVLYTAAYTVIPSFGSILGDIRASLDRSDNATLTSKIREINSYVDDYYIYDYDKESMADLALSGYVSGLEDPYSEYISKADYTEMLEEISGDYKGIGIEVYIDDDKLITVLSSFEKSPAAKAGIVAGDKIISVNGTSVSFDNYNEAINMIKGTGKYADTSDEVTLTIKRGDGEFEIGGVLGGAKRKTTPYRQKCLKTGLVISAYLSLPKIRVLTLKAPQGCLLQTVPSH